MALEMRYDDMALYAHGDRYEVKVNGTTIHHGKCKKDIVISGLTTPRKRKVTIRLGRIRMVEKRSSQGIIKVYDGWKRVAILKKF